VATSASAPLVELGAVLLGLAMLSRLATRLRVVPLAAPLLAGLVLGGLGPLARRLGPSPQLVDAAMPVAVVLLLFSLGLDHGARDRIAAVARGSRLGAVDGALNAVPGAVAGWLIGPGLRGAALLAGVTWASSWAAATGLLGRRGWMGNRETPAVLSILVLEHLGLAAYLPPAAALLTPGRTARVAASVLAAVVAVIAAAWLMANRSRARRPIVFPPGMTGGSETGLVALAGVALTIAGLAEGLRIPAAGAAYLAGAVLAAATPAGLVGPDAGRLGPAVDMLRELSATGAFLLVGCAVGGGGALPGAVPAAVALGVLATATKLLTGSCAATRLGVAAGGRRRAGVALVARGEVSIALAGLAVAAGLDRLAATAVVCVLVTQAAAAGLRLPLAPRSPASPRSDPRARRTPAS
jgi:CPA2 family monovalent cation:H+ antiporter-2